MSDWECVRRGANRCNGAPACVACERALAFLRANSVGLRLATAAQERAAREAKSKPIPQLEARDRGNVIDFRKAKWEQAIARALTPYGDRELDGPTMGRMRRDAVAAILEVEARMLPRGKRLTWEQADRLMGNVFDEVLGRRRAKS